MMKYDKELIKQKLDEVAMKWDISGNFFLLKDGDVLHNNYYGFADRNREIATKSDTLYSLDSEESFFISLAILVAVDHRKIALKDSLIKFIPEFSKGAGITIEHLLRNESGLIDFYHEKLMVELESDPSYLALSEHDRVRKEKQVLYENRNFDKAYALIESCDLEYEPGIKSTETKTNAVFLCEVLKRATGRSSFEYLKEFIFEPLDMKSVKKSQPNETLSYRVHKRTELVAMPVVYEVQGIFDLTAEDILKLMNALSGRKIFSENLWKKVFRYSKEGKGIIFSDSNGFDIATTEFLGYGFYFYVSQQSGVAFASLVNEHQTFRFYDNTWNYFRKDSREAVTSLLTYPENTKMIKLNKHNLWAALDLSVEKEQYNFVLEAKSSVAMALMYKTKQAYVQTEGKLAVGLLVLNVDKKKNDYNIDIVLIDKRFQNRGFGKLMIKWAVDYLKNEGAASLTIGVNRHNIAAKKLYMSAGFSPKSVYEGGMELSMDL